MGVYLGRELIGTILEPDTTRNNIACYKTQDIVNITQNGGELATDEEYEQAEKKLQSMYAMIMGDDK